VLPRYILLARIVLAVVGAASLLNFIRRYRAYLRDRIGREGDFREKEVGRLLRLERNATALFIIAYLFFLAWLVSDGMGWSCFLVVGFAAGAIVLGVAGVVAAIRYGLHMPPRR